MCISFLLNRRAVQLFRVKSASGPCVLHKPGASTMAAVVVIAAQEQRRSQRKSYLQEQANTAEFDADHDGHVLRFALRFRGRCSIFETT